MSKKQYTIPVNFTTTINIDVTIDDDMEDVGDALADAKFDATRIFSTLMAEGSLCPSDFVAEAQEP